MVLSAIDQCILWRGMLFLRFLEYHFLSFVVHYYLTFYLYNVCLCRYLGELKSNVRNKARPEGCIAESVLAKEAMALCSRFIDCFESLLNNVSRNDDYDETLGCDTSQASTLFPYAGTALGKPRSYVIRGLAKLQAHRYVLFNCSDVNPYLRYNLRLININSIFS